MNTLNIISIAWACVSIIFACRGLYFDNKAKKNAKIMEQHFKKLMEDLNNTK